MHCPAVGVNVYVPDAWSLTTAGLHVPFIPLSETGVNDGTEFRHYKLKAYVPKLNVGVMFGFTVTVNVAGIVH